MKVRLEDDVRSPSPLTHGKPWTSPRVITAEVARDTALGSIISYPENAPTPFGGTGSGS